MTVSLASASLGETLHGIVYPPVNMEEGKKYPTVVYVYGGPSVQASAIYYYYIT